MSDDNTGASATELPPPPAPPAGAAPTANVNNATDIELPKEKVALAATSKASDLPEPGVSTGDQEVSDKPDDGGAAENATGGPVESANDDKAMDASEPGPAPTTGGGKESPVADKVATPSSKAKARRKSTGGGESKGKKLNKKASKAKFTHLDAKPGDHFFVKLKGFPPWPAIICDENMLPQALIKSRPVTAAREDGTYRDDYADGGKRVADRTYPVMYLHTNEFGWIPNTDLHDLNPETVLDVKMDKMRKDLQAAHQLASENNSLQHYKEVLQHYQDDLLEKQKAKEAKAQSTPAKKSKKAKAEVDDDEDVDMADAVEEGVKEKKAKKRKADESAETPQRSDSVKKPKIKLTVNSTPKTSNGTAPKSKGQTSAAKPVKIKNKKADSEPKDTMADNGESKVDANGPPVTPEVQLARKEKEVLFTRHKLQKGLLSRDVKPKAEEMPLMADFLTKLEKLENLEANIIRATKINKVLKAILKLKEIPREEEFQFKPRSQALLDVWNKVLEAPTADGSGNELAQAMDGVVTEGTDSKKEMKSSADDNTHGESKTNGTQEKNATEEKKSVAEDKGVSEKSDAEEKDVAATEAPVAAADKATDKEAAAVEASG